MSEWRSGVCEANGIGIHYTRTGGDKPPLILLHGLMTSGGCWTDLARVLEHRHDVIMPDARGHGGSSAPDHGYRYDDLADDVCGLIDALALPSPILLGHSMGGMTAAVVASRRPRRLRGLILADPTFLEPEVQRAVWESDVADKHRRVLERTFEEVVADGRARHPDRSLETVERFARARLQTHLGAFEVLRPPNPDFRQLVRRIDVPGLLVVGDGGVVSGELAAELKGLNPGLEVEEIRGAGHALHLDRPARFAAVVSDFLGTLGAGSGRELASD